MFVVFRTGKVVEYNDAYYVEENPVTVTLRQNSKTTTFEAIIPLELIERIDGKRPCQVAWVNMMPKAGQADY